MNLFKKAQTDKDLLAFERIGLPRRPSHMSTCGSAMAVISSTEESPTAANSPVPSGNIQKLLLFLKNLRPKLTQMTHEVIQGR